MIRDPFVPIFVGWAVGGITFAGLEASRPIPFLVQAVIGMASFIAARIVFAGLVEIRRRRIARAARGGDARATSLWHGNAWQGTQEGDR